MVKQVLETIPFKEAMDNLARLSNLDLATLPRIGIVGKYKIVTDETEFPEVEVLWLTGEGSEPLVEVVDLTIQSVHEQLIRLLKNMDWESEKSRKALESMMALTSEGVSRLEKYLELSLDKKISLTKRAAFVALQDDYATLYQQIKQDAPQEATDQLDNMETVRRDSDYELFYIRKEDGSPYFSTQLLRHMRLVSDFESEGESFEEDPLLQVRAMIDRDLQASSQQILQTCHPLISDFYKLFKKLPNHQFADMLSQSIMALLLSANPRNLLQNTTSKSCQQYFEDFLYFLRTSFRTDEYQKLVAYPPEKNDKTAHLLLNLAHTLAHALYTRAGGVKQEAVGLIHRTTRKGMSPMQGKIAKGDTLWSQLSIDDENFRSRLEKFPNGPLFKILDVIRIDEGEKTPFDPMMQGNVPMQLFGIQAGRKQIDFLRIPSPTKQLFINKGEIIDEMRGFLRFYNTGGAKKKHLLINLQDRTSWKEFIRCKLLEEMQKNAEFNPSFAVVTLAKNTDFYSQVNEYEEIGRADLFCSMFLKQMEDAQGCGFYFPPSLQAAPFLEFIRSLISFVHLRFFEKKQTLSRREREDFIEIAYQFLVLKLIDHYAPTTVSFTCKDAIDTGAASAALMYAFIQLFKGQFEEKKNLDYFRWLLYAPSLFVRERAIDPERFTRVLTVLERIDQGMKKDLKGIVSDAGKLFSPGFLDTLSVV